MALTQDETVELTRLFLASYIEGDRVTGDRGAELRSFFGAVGRGIHLRDPAVVSIRPERDLLPFLDIDGRSFRAGTGPLGAPSNYLVFDRCAIARALVRPAGAADVEVRFLAADSYT